jgi:uncharacterized lipoprotein YddW (UPF0748 family)
MKIISNYLLLLCSVILLFTSCSKESDGPSVSPQPTPDPPSSELKFPRKEIRAAWMATVWGIDWPTSKEMAVQKKQYTDLLDRLKQLKFNTVFVQVRGMGDAFYNSPYEPWSGNITGTRGKDPGYDVLKFMLDEAHARGIEFHAWINPYRIATRAGSNTSYPALHSSIQQSWVVDHEKIQIYNPALPEVRQRLSDIVKDLVTKYDVDGLHMDDYFYPDPSSAGTMKSDDEDFNRLKGNFTDKNAWRRDNVDKAIELIYNTIKTHKPSVVFSISPAASRSYNYNTLYADLPKWTQAGWVDILIPQLYQEIGNSSNPFERNLADWTQFRGKSKVVIGHGYYKFGANDGGAKFQNVQELENQFNLVRNNRYTVGSAIYSSRDILANRIGITDKLAELYAKDVLMPFAGREVATAPVVPSNLKLTGSELNWVGSGNNIRFAVYYFSSLTVEGEIVGVTTANKINVTKNGHYAVTALNEDHVESKPSNTVEKK